MKLWSQQNILLEREMIYPTKTSTKINMTRFDIKMILLYGFSSVEYRSGPMIFPVYIPTKTRPVVTLRLVSPVVF